MMSGEGMALIMMYVFLAIFGVLSSPTERYSQDFFHLADGWNKASALVIWHFMEAFFVVFICGYPG
jgi:hypothetical protein